MKEEFKEDRMRIPSFEHNEFISLGIDVSLASESNILG